MSVFLKNLLKNLDDATATYTLELCDKAAAAVEKLSGEHEARSLLFGSALRSEANKLCGPARTAFLQKTYNRSLKVFNELEERTFDEVLPLRAAWDDVRQEETPLDDRNSQMSEAECRQGFAAAARLIAHYDRLFIVHSYHVDKSMKSNAHCRQGKKEFAKLAEKLAAKVDRLEAEVLCAQKELREKQQDASALDDRIGKLASGFEQLAGLQAAKKNARMPMTSRLEKSLANLKEKLEDLEGVNVSQKDLEAREKEVSALKAENTKLLENVGDAHADRQRALEDNESLREQLQKLRAEKQADGSGKKKKNK